MDAQELINADAIETSLKVSSHAVDEREMRAEYFHDIQSPLMSLKAGLSLLDSMKNKASASSGEFDIVLERMRNQIVKIDRAARLLKASLRD